LALLIREVFLVHLLELLAQSHVECNQVVEGVDKPYFVSGDIECGAFVVDFLAELFQRSTWRLTLFAAMRRITARYVLVDKFFSQVLSMACKVVRCLVLSRVSSMVGVGLQMPSTNARSLSACLNEVPISSSLFQ
jgi:hypothetical protein